jgi:hypothetical protein
MRRFKEFLGEFNRGFRTGSPWLIALSFAASLLLAAMIEVAFSSGLVWKLPVELLLPDIRNDWIFQAHRLNHLNQRGRNGRDLFILGGSSCREAFVGEEALQEQLERAGLPGFKVYNTCTSSQTMADTLLILEYLGPGPGYVFIGLNPLKFSYGLEILKGTVKGHRFIIKSRDVKQELEALGARFPFMDGFYFWRAGPYLGELLLKPVKVLGDFINRRQFTLRHQFLHHAHRPPLTPEDRERNKLELKNKQFKDFLSNKDLNLGLFSKAVRKAKGSGFQVILFELPMNPIVRDLYRENLGTYKPMVREFAKAHQVPYLEFMWKLDLTRHDFFDFSHLLGRGRTLYQDAFVDQVKGLIL